MSNNTVNAALRRLGYSNTQMTGHGFRGMASTLLNEQGWHPDLIELQPRVTEAAAARRVSLNELVKAALERETAEGAA